MSDTIYLKVTSLSNGQLVGVVHSRTSGADVPADILKGLAQLLCNGFTDRSFSGNQKLFGDTILPAASVYDYITPAGLMADASNRFYGLNGSLQGMLKEGGMVVFLVDNDPLVDELSVEGIKALLYPNTPSGHKAPQRVVSFKHYQEPVGFVDREHENAVLVPKVRG